MSTSSAPRPNFFIVGAARAGTTSLYRVLQQHPDVFMPENKEPGFFSPPPPGWEAFSKPASRELDAYLGLFAGAGARPAIGEASVMYLTAPESARRIHQFNPDARIIIVLRQPADRAYSLYRYMCMRGLEAEPTFERALADEERRLARCLAVASAPWLHAGCYFDSGLYAAQVARYLEVFPREQVQIVVFDDFKKDPAGTARGVMRFLGLDDSVPLLEKFRNRSPFVGSVRAQAFLARHWHLHPMRRPGTRRIGFVDRGLIPAAFILNAHLGRLRGTAMNAETRRALSRRYRPDVERTATLVERSLEHWLERT
jgi:hypothetical protein